MRIDNKARKKNKMYSTRKQMTIYHIQIRQLYIIVKNIIIPGVFLFGVSF